MGGKFIVFEGIDGSGKTTLSNRVARALRDDGLTVEHVREGGKFASNVTQAVRELGRDARNLDMSPHTELLLYAARDAQLLDEATRPALGRADVVFADRFLYSAEILARHGRGLSVAEVAPIIAGAGRGLEPDLVILVDVDPHVARARRRIAKIITPDPRPSSRKGLSGVGLQHRLREGYRELAAQDPARWVVVDNTEADLDQQTAHLIDLVRVAVKQGTPAAREQAHRVAARPALPVASPEQALPLFLAWVDRQAAREPALAAYFLSGLAGRGAGGPAGNVDERREALAAKVPEIIAYGLRGLTDPASWALRRGLMAVAPRWVARSVAALAGSGEQATTLRRELAAVVPADVAASLDGRDDDEAWALRTELAAAAPDAVVVSTKRIATERAWRLREEWLEARGGTAALASFDTVKLLCDAISGVPGERAWELRKAAREVAPVDALDSTAGLVDDKAWSWRTRYLPTATKVVMRTIAGSDDPRAWALREAVAGRCKEALDSIVGLTGDAAWRLREAHAETWPSTAAKSLGPLAATPRGLALVGALLSRHGSNVSLLKHAASIALGASDDGSWEG